MKTPKIQYPRMSRAEMNRRADAFRKAVQAELLPEHADDIIAINLETGEYVVGPSVHEAHVSARERWPHQLMYLCRPNGRPVIKFHGR